MGELVDSWTSTPYSSQRSLVARAEPGAPLVECAFVSPGVALADYPAAHPASKAVRRVLLPARRPGGTNSFQLHTAGGISPRVLTPARKGPLTLDGPSPPALSFSDCVWWAGSVDTRHASSDLAALLPCGYPSPQSGGPCSLAYGAKKGRVPGEGLCGLQAPPWRLDSGISGEGALPIAKFEPFAAGAGRDPLVSLEVNYLYKARALGLAWVCGSGCVRLRLGIPGKL